MVRCGMPRLIYQQSELRGADLDASVWHRGVALSTLKAALLPEPASQPDQSRILVRIFCGVFRLGVGLAMVHAVSRQGAWL
jgi:hypothetical protein